MGMNSHSRPATEHSPLSIDFILGETTARRPNLTLQKTPSWKPNSRCESEEIVAFYNPKVNYSVLKEFTTMSKPDEPNQEPQTLHI
jgi:hypothetical protein